VVNNIRQNKWWAGTRTDSPMVLICTDDIPEDKPVTQESLPSHLL
jgi:hypothetical protein